jgi:hypothetical protein
MYRERKPTNDLSFVNSDEYPHPLAPMLPDPIAAFDADENLISGGMNFRGDRARPSPEAGWKDTARRSPA